MTDNAGARPVGSAPYGRFRDAVWTISSSVLAATGRPLWYAESVVLSARYQQWLRSMPWAGSAVRYRDRLLLWEKAAMPLLRSARAGVLEFGVADGFATQWWADAGVDFLEWHGFDTFEGLPAAWARAGIPVMAAGGFSPDAGVGATPTVQASYPFEWHKGLIEDTLPGFKRPEAPLFLFVDVDLLEPTQVIVEWLSENGKPGDIVYFDEAFDPWNEGLAIRDAAAAGLEFRAIAYTGSALLIELT